jgi:hypothetical protein
MKFFQKTNMISESVYAAMRSGLYQIYPTGATAAVDAGAFVIAHELADNEVYNEYLGAGALKDFNTFIIKAPLGDHVTASNANLYVVDPVKVPEATNGTLVYREGARTLGLAGNPGEKVAIRKLFLNDMFILGADNFETAAVVGEFATLTATTTNLTPASLLPSTGFAVRVECEWHLTQGITASNGFLCTVVQL